VTDVSHAPSPATAGVECSVLHPFARTHTYIDWVGRIRVAHKLEWGHTLLDWCSSGVEIEGSRSAGHAQIFQVEHSLGDTLCLAKTDRGESHIVDHLSANSRA